MVRKTEITEANLYEALAKVLRDERLYKNKSPCIAFSDNCAELVSITCFRYRKRAKEIASMISALPDTPQRIFLEGIEFAAKFNVRYSPASFHIFLKLELLRLHIR